MTTKKLRLGSIVIDCDDFPRMVAFWREALHYVPREPPSDGWVVLRDPEGRGPNVSLNRASEGPLDDYRLHLDLYTADQEREVARLLDLGATIRRTPEEGRTSWSSRTRTGTRSAWWASAGSRGTGARPAYVFSTRVETTGVSRWGFTL